MPWRTRREIVSAIAVMTLSSAEDTRPGKPRFRTRGVVLTPDDLTLEDWPERAKSSGLTTIALHPFPKPITEFVASGKGRSFLADCHKLGLQVEYELHAMSDLMPRGLFAERPEYFRAD